jgi:hypothetical protein
MTPSLAGISPTNKVAGKRLPLKAGGGQSRMTPAQEAALCTWLEGRFWRSTVEIQAHIAAEFDLEYSHSGCIKLLARLGFECREPKPLSRVAAAEKQAAFIALYERLMGELRADEAAYFADAVQPEYRAKPAFGWVKVGSNPAVHSTAGRGRVNIHGALNLETFDAPFVDPRPLMGAVPSSFLPRSRSATPASASIISSGTTPPTSKDQMSGLSLQGKPAVSTRSSSLPIAHISIQLNVFGRSCTSMSPTTAATEVRSSSPMQSSRSCVKPFRKNGKLSRQGVR